MRYDNITRAVFIKRPNRFIAEVYVNGKKETVHVKNTGRCREWLDKQDYDKVIPEYTYGESRIDFYMERAGKKYLMEVKGCTLEIDGIGYFPDAPTERGIKHLHELAGAVKSGYKAMLAFVIQMDGVEEVRANIDTHPEFGTALDAAKAAGVEVLFLKCHVEPDTLVII